MTKYRLVAEYCRYNDNIIWQLQAKHGFFGDWRLTTTFVPAKDSTLTEDMAVTQAREIIASLKTIPL